MKNFDTNKSGRLILVLFFLFLFVNTNALYLGWNKNRLERYLNRHAGYRIDRVKEDPDELTFTFEQDVGIKKMVFYLTDGKCSAYSITYDLRYGKDLKEFLSDRYTYNRERDYFEDKRRRLYYSGGLINHEIYIEDKRFVMESSISMK